MRRLIDVDALKEALGGLRAYYNCFDEDERKFYEAYSKAIAILNAYLDTAQTTDAVEVVRCRDCAFSRDTGDYQDTYHCDHPTHNKMHLVHSREYCYYGVRREQ